MTNVIQFRPRPNAPAIVAFPPRPAYRVTMTYDEVATLCRRWLSVLTVGDAGPQAQHVAREGLQYVAAECPYVQGRELARDYLSAADKPGPGGVG